MGTPTEIADRTILEISRMQSRIGELEGVVSVLLGVYLSADMFDGNKDALAHEAERLVPNWKQRAKDWQPPKQ